MSDLDNQETQEELDGENTEIEETGDETTPVETEEPEEQETDSTPEQEEKYFLDARTDGKGSVYKSVEDAIAGIRHKDEYIERLKRENELLNAIAEKQKSVETKPIITKPEPKAEPDELTEVQKAIAEELKGEYDDESANAIARAVTKGLKTIETKRTEVQKREEQMQTIAKERDALSAVVKAHSDNFLDIDTAVKILENGLTNHPDYQKAVNTEALAERAARLGGDYETALKTIIPWSTETQKREIEKNGAKAALKAAKDNQARLEKVPGVGGTNANDKVERVDFSKMTEAERERYREKLAEKFLKGGAS